MRVVTACLVGFALGAFGGASGRADNPFADDAVESQAADHTLAEITVTARKRDEMLEKAPASVTAVTDTDLKGGWFPGLASAASAAGPYGDETMDAAEVGVKSFLRERRARISADVFYENIQGLQRSVVFLENGISNNLTRNAANSISKGVEMETAFLPLDALTIKANGGYLDAYYTSFCANFVATDVSRPACGNQPGEVDNTNLLPSNAPRWTLALSAEYRTPMGDIGELNFHIDESYTTSLWTADDNNPISHRAPEALLNAAIRFSAADDRYSLSIWGHNLTDKIVTEVGVTAYPLFSLWNPTPPRTFGLTLEGKLGRRRP